MFRAESQMLPDSFKKKKKEKKNNCSSDGNMKHVEHLTPHHRRRGVFVYV